MAPTAVRGVHDRPEASIDKLKREVGRHASLAMQRSYTSDCLVQQLLHKRSRRASSFLLCTRGALCVSTDATNFGQPPCIHKRHTLATPQPTRCKHTKRRYTRVATQNWCMQHRQPAAPWVRVVQQQQTAARRLGHWQHCTLRPPHPAWGGITYQAARFSQ